MENQHDLQNDADKGQPEAQQSNLRDQKKNPEDSGKLAKSKLQRKCEQLSTEFVRDCFPY